jgi:hypothetical protein
VGAGEACGPQPTSSTLVRGRSSGSTTWSMTAS